MQRNETFFLDSVRRLRDRAARYRRFSSLLGEDGTGRLKVLADEAEKLVGQIVGEIQAQSSGTRVLVAEIDALLARTRDAALSKRSFALRGAAEDMREAARLCAEEARAVSDPSDRRELAAKVADLAHAAQAIDPDSGDAPGAR